MPFLLELFAAPLVGLIIAGSLLFWRRTFSVEYQRAHKHDPGHYP